jgi:hypothetical protein
MHACAEGCATRAALRARGDPLPARIQNPHH